MDFRWDPLFLYAGYKDLGWSVSVLSLLYKDIFICSLISFSVLLFYCNYIVIYINLLFAPNL